MFAELRPVDIGIPSFEGSKWRLFIILGDGPDRDRRRAHASAWRALFCGGTEARLWISNAGSSSP